LETIFAKKKIPANLVTISEAKKKKMAADMRT